VGNINEDVHEANGPHVEQHQGNLRHRLGAMQPHVAVQARIFGGLQHEEHRDCVWLLQEIQGITHRFEGTRNVFISLDDAWSSYYAYRQGHNQTLHEYLKEFQALVQVLEHYGAALGAEAPYQDSVNAKIMADDGLTPAEYRTRLVAVAKKKSVAIGFLKRADRKRYGGLWSDLENTYTRGQDRYPTDLTGAYNLLLNYKPPPFTSTDKTRQARTR
jgi:hypothetical protein